MPDFNTNLGALGPMQANQSQSMSKMSWGPYAEAYEQKFGYNPNLIKAPEEGFTRPSLQEQMEFNSAWDKANPYVAPTFPEGLSHPGGISTMALVNWYNEKTGQRYTANSGGYQAAPGSGWRIVKPTSYEGKIGGGIGEIVSQDPINMPGFVGPTYSAPSSRRHRLLRQHSRVWGQRPPPVFRLYRQKYPRRRRRAPALSLQRLLMRQLTALSLQRLLMRQLTALSLQRLLMRQLTALSLQPQRHLV
jgi:hypothetical protein